MAKLTITFYDYDPVPSGVATKSVKVSYGEAGLPGPPGPPGGVVSVAGRDGVVTLTKADVGLSNVDNTPDTNKPVSTAQATADASVATAASNALSSHVSDPDPHTGYQKENEKGVANGYAPLGADNLVPLIHLPASSGSGTDVQRFLTAGTHTWTNPSPSTRKLGKFRIIGGGGGGGSGRKGAPGTVRCGGGGGAGGNVQEQYFWTDQMAATISVVVGAGGAGGASVSSNSTNGNAGVAGGQSTFGQYFTGGGNAGSGGTSSSGTGGAGLGSGGFIFGTLLNGNAGHSANSTGLVSDPSNVLSPTPTGGASGGGITSADVAGRGAHGQHNGSGNHGSTPQIYGSLPNTGLTGWRAAATQLWSTSGRGGSGGGAATVGNAGAGADGRGPGGGGAGGGAATDSVGNSGAGGAGEPGMVEVIVWL